MIKEEVIVALQQIDAKMLSKMFLAGAKNLENKKEWINELNVFPVPDGDTGTDHVCGKRSFRTGRRCRYGCFM